MIGLITMLSTKCLADTLANNLSPTDRGAGTMWCDKFKSIMTREACIRRQKIAQQNFVTLKIRIREGVFHYRQVNVPESFSDCVNCEQGVKVSENPDNYSDNDVTKLSQNHLEQVTCRGFLYRERMPMDIRSLEMSGNIEKAELNYIEGRHNVDVELIGRVSTYNISKRRKINGTKSKIVIGNGGKGCTLTDRSIRIIRYLCKQGYFARSESNLLQSIGSCAAVG
jgi:hypothetical protein